MKRTIEKVKSGDRIFVPCVWCKGHFGTVKSSRRFKDPVHGFSAIKVVNDDGTIADWPVGYFKKVL